MHPPHGEAPAASSRAPGLARIGRPVAVRSLPAIVFTGGFAAPGLALATVGWSEDAAVLFPIALVAWLVVPAGSMLLHLTLAYRTVAVDLEAGTARLGRTTVPLSSITAAQRQTPRTPSGRHLSYRFESTDGAWGRVLVEGGPFRRLAEADILLLARFVEATAIRHTGDQSRLDPLRQRKADTVSGYGMRSPVGKRAILVDLLGVPDEDLDDELGAVTEETVRQWERDDREAERFLRSRPRTGRSARRWLGWLTVAAAAAAVAVTVAAVVAEQQTATGRLASNDNDLVVVWFLITAGLGLAAYLAYASACLTYLRRSGDAALEWIASRGPDQVVRGVPHAALEPFHDHPPAHRLKNFGGYTSLVAGLIFLLAGLVLLATELEVSPRVGLSLLSAGVGCSVVGAAALISAQRAITRQEAFAARLGGARRFAAMELLGHEYLEADPTERNESTPDPRT